MDYKAEISHLEKQLEFFNELIEAMSPSNIGYTEMTSVIGPMLKLNYDTGQSIKLLAEHNHLRDFIVLSRPFIESIINVGFICAKGSEAIIKSKKYAYQKGYRDLFKSIQIEDFKIDVGLDDVHKDLLVKHLPQNMIDALKEFTSKKGKEITSWTNETTKEKIEIISKKYGIWVNGLLTFAFFNIYKDVSEIIHGSYYGVRIFLGMQNKDISSFKSSEDAANYFTKHQFQLGTLILQQVNISIVALIEIINQDLKGYEKVNIIKEKAYNTLIEYVENAKTIK